MKKLFLILFGTALSYAALAQQDSMSRKQIKKKERRDRIESIIKQEEDGVITYTRHSALGVKLTTDGYGAFAEIGRAKTVKKSWLFQLDISERKHPKEEKQQVNFNTTAPIIFGKINFFYPIKLGVQQQFTLGNKGNKNGVSVTGNIGGGVIVGLLRPYQIQIDSTGGGDRNWISYEQNPEDYFKLNYYIGGPTLFKGWSDLKVTPGVYLKPAVRFDYGKYNEMITALEVGLTAEFYSKKIPQMIAQKQEQFFFSAYVAVVFGRRK